ncbi:MAG: helix-turn-helix domain-containing protein [Pseudomonadota bacterium]
MTLQAQSTRFEAASQAVTDPWDVIGVRMPYAAGEEIYAQEERADMVYRVTSGAVRTTRLLSDGRRQIGDFYYPGDVFGLESGEEHRFSADALSTANILVIKRSALSHHGEDGARIERALWAATAQELRRTQEHLSLLGCKSACEKVAAFMLDVADRTKGELAILSMGRQDMADYLGITIETVCRMLRQLQDDAIVEFVGNRKFRLRQRAALARLVPA